jgi:putative ABC transport system permease protein
MDVTTARAIPGNEATARVEVEGLPAPLGTASQPVSVNRVGVDFFAAFETSLLTGRAWNQGETNAVIVNRTFVDQVLRGGDALGRRVRYVEAVEDDSRGSSPGQWFEIVGVVNDLHANAIDPGMARAEIFHALAADEPALLFARVRGGAPASYVPRAREIVATIDAAARVNVFPMVQIYRQQNLALRLVALVLGLIVFSVLLLSAAGIYALMSFTVAQRRKEIGIRAALGAEPRRLLRSVFARAAAQLAIGVGVGLTVTVILDALSDGDLLMRQDRILLPLVSVLMLITGLLAAFGPARRGLRIQPIEALRED